VALLALLLSTAAAAQTLPNQCRLIENRSNGVIIAECSTAQGERSSAIRPTECRASLSSRDGVLSCAGSTALVGPVRTTTTEGRIGDLLANVLGAPRPNMTSDTSWADNFRPSEDRRIVPETRIAEALKARTITAAEAATLRRAHKELIALDSRYAADGRFTPEEYADLEERTTKLGTEIDAAIATRDIAANPDWASLASRRTDFDNRLFAALDARVINLAEANRLRADWASLVNVEASYERGGLDTREIADLQSRLNGLETRLGRFGTPTDSRNVKSAQSWADLTTLVSERERDRSLGRFQIERLRTELGDLTRLDAAWRQLDRGRLTSEQQAYLDQRHADITGQLEDAQRRRR